MDKLLAIRAFMDVAQEGGFSKAARRLGVATSSVTRLIDALEESLGTALVTRNTREVTLTDAGVNYLDQVAKVLSDLEEADGSIADRGTEPAGPLRVAMPVTFGRLCMGPHFANFLKRHLRMSLDLVLSDAMVDLSIERIDVAVRIGTALEQPGLIVRKLGDHQRFVVASNGYLIEAGVPKTPAELTLHECLRFSYQSGHQHWSFKDPHGHIESIEVGGRLSANNSDVLRDAVLGGFGIALLPRWLVDSDVESGRMQRLFQSLSVNPHDDGVCVYAAYLPNRRHSSKVQAFISFLVERASDGEFARQHAHRQSLAVADSVRVSR